MPQEPTPSLEEASEFAAALGHALDLHQVTLAGLQEQLARRGHKVSIATLSYWRSGRSLPTRRGSLETVAAIEELLELPHNTLIAALNNVRSPAWSPVSVLPDSERPNDVLEQLGLSLSGPLRTVVQHDMLHVGNPSGMERELVRQVVRASTDGVTRMPGIFYGSDKVPLPVVNPGHGLQVGQVVPIRASNCIVVEFLFTAALDEGELHWFEYEVEWQEDGELVNSHGRTAYRGAELITLGVKFGRDRPVAARFLHEVPAARKSGIPSEKDITSELRTWDPVPEEIQHTVRHAPPGIYAVEWYLEGATGFDDE